MKKYISLTSFLLLVAGRLHATPITYFTEMTGPLENPPNASPGTGSATVVYDPDAHTLSVSATFTGLMGTTTAAHIHCCIDPPGATSVATQTPSFIGFPLGVTSGAFANVYDLTDPGSFRPQFITANGGTAAGAEAALASGLENGQAYFNIHTTVFGGGEIRGFLQVPEPTSFALIVLALGTMALVKKRRT